MHSMALRLATHILVNSEAIAARLAHTRAARDGRLSVIRNGVDLARFAPEARPSNDREPITPSRPWPTCGPRRGSVQLVEAAAIVARRAPRAGSSSGATASLRSGLEARIRALGA